MARIEADVRIALVIGQDHNDVRLAGSTFFASGKPGQCHRCRSGAEPL